MYRIIKPYTIYFCNLWKFVIVRAFIGCIGYDIYFFIVLIFSFTGNIDYIFSSHQPKATLAYACSFPGDKKNREKELPGGIIYIP